MASREQVQKLSVFLPMRTRTPGNTRRHWRIDWAEAKKQRAAAKMLLQSAGNRVGTPVFPVKVTLTRVSTRKLDRHNIPGALKHVIDGIADFYGVDDGDERWDFQFGQEAGKTPGVNILIESKEPPHVG